MSMLRTSLMFLALLAAPLPAQPDDPSAGLMGRVQDRMYIAPSGTYRLPIPVLPELGGSITDTANVVTFQDNFNLHVSIGVFPQDATQRWEMSTRGLKDYLGYFLTTFVMPDFQAAYPGSQVESAGFAPGVMNGAMFAYLLLPGGSMFADKRVILGVDDTPVVAKRGNLIFVRNGRIFVITTELAERVTERSTYRKTVTEENQILRDRLLDLARKMEFPRPAAAP
jgi:hypothetical protein